MADKKTQYPFKFDVDGPVHKWMQNQKNKSRSLEYLVKWAVDNFGEDDIIDSLMTKALRETSPLNMSPVDASSKTETLSVNPQNTISHKQPDVMTSTEQHTVVKHTTVTPQSSEPKATQRSTATSFKPVSKPIPPGIIDSMTD